MSEKAQLLAATRQAHDRHAAARGSIAGRDTAAPTPGDVFVLPATAAFDVEWAVIDRDGPATGTESLLVVPADGCSLVGSGDIALPESSATGFLVLRCRLAVRVAPGLLARRSSTGTLSPATLAAAKERLRAIEAGELLGSVVDREVDEESEYEDWVAGVLTPARQALLAAAESAAEAPEPTASKPRRAAAWLPLAASILLLVGAGLAAGLLWRQQQRIEALRAELEGAALEHGAEIARLEAERATADAEHRRQLAQGQEERSRLTERIAELGKRLETSEINNALINPQLVPLRPRSEVRGPSSVRVPPGASHVLFLLQEPQAGEPGSRYRLEILAPGAQSPLWRSLEVSADQGEIRVGPRASQLLPGEVRLRLVLLDRNRERAVEEYEVVIEKN